MDKKDVIRALEEIAILLELSGENPFKVRSYENAARILGNLSEDIEALVAEKRLRTIKGIGEALEQKITELVTTGRLGYLEELRAKFPPSLLELFHVPGLGAKRIKALYENLGVDSLEKLKEACEAGTVVQLHGFDHKLQQKILEGLAFAAQHEGTFLLDTAMEHAEALVEHLRRHAPLQRIMIAGSLRRYKETIKDIDIVASSEYPEAVMEEFVKAPGVAHVVSHGTTRSSVVLKNRMAADLRVVTDAQFPFALAYFTGSKQHNVVMRQRAKERGLKLNEYGLFAEDDHAVACTDEADIFRALGLPYIPPEIREDLGEFELKETPRLVDRSDLRGLIHCHTTYSDGVAGLEEMAIAARDAGYEYFVVADHSQSAAYAGGMKPNKVKQQHKAIDALNERLAPFRILKGIECDIRKDGSLDYEDEVLYSFDVVIVSVHSHLDMGEAEATERLLRAMAHPCTTIVGHPTGRLLKQRPGYPLNWEAVFEAAVEHRVAIEINANCHRLDIDWRNVRRGRDQGVMFSIGPDAHQVPAIADVRYGVGMARKGWLGPEQVLNCLTWEELLEWKKRKK
jgi:DNA polymerase (family 10)